MFVEAEIAGRTYEHVAAIPRAALREGHRVLVLDDESRLYFRDVEVLRQTRDEAFVAGGLADGDRVCVSALAAVTDGMQVRVPDGEDGA